MRVYLHNVLSRPYISRMDSSCSASILMMLSIPILYIGVYFVLSGFFRNCPSYPFSNISLAVNNSLPQRSYMVHLSFSICCLYPQQNHSIEGWLQHFLRQINLFQVRMQNGKVLSNRCFCISQ